MVKNFLKISAVVIFMSLCFLTGCGDNGAPAPEQENTPVSDTVPSEPITYATAIPELYELTARIDDIHAKKFGTTLFAGLHDWYDYGEENGIHTYIYWHDIALYLEPEIIVEVDEAAGCWTSVTVGQSYEHYTEETDGIYERYVIASVAAAFNDADGVAAESVLPRLRSTATRIDATAQPYSSNQFYRGDLCCYSYIKSGSEKVRIERMSGDQLARKISGGVNMTEI